MKRIAKTDASQIKINNYILSDHSDYVVIEADEFDRSFHWLRPWMTVSTARSFGCSEPSANAA